MKNMSKTGVSKNLRHFACLSIVLTLLSGHQQAFAGGYTTSDQPLTPFGIPLTLQPLRSSLPSYNNEFFTNKINISSINNDIFRTPSTLDPISTVTGNNYHDETDIRIKGRNDLNYVFTRTYNSTSRGTGGVLGYGWVHSYMMQLKSNDFGNCPNCDVSTNPENGNNIPSSITYTDERGGDHNYLVNETTKAISAPRGEYAVLSRNTPSTGLYTLAFRHGVSYVFEPESTTTSSALLENTPNKVARLKQIKNQWGDVLNFGYDTTAWPGKLTSVTDNLAISGRTGLVLTYHASGNGVGKLKDIADWSGRKWSFTYDAQQNLETMDGPLPGSTDILTYGYVVPTKHLLTSVRKPLLRDGKPVETRFVYYENGRGFQQTDSSDKGDTLDYDLYRRATRVTDARGGVRQFHYDENGGLTRLEEPDGAILLFENQTDSALRFKKTDALGYSTSYSYRTDGAIGVSLASTSNGNVTREQDANNNTIDTTYSNLYYDQVERVKDKRGYETYTVFYTATDAVNKHLLGRPRHEKVKQLTWVPADVRADVTLKTYYWNSDGTINKIVEQFTPTLDARTRVTTYEYQASSANLLVSAVETKGYIGTTLSTSAARTSYTYDSLGRVKTQSVQRRTSPSNAALLTLTTTYDYDELDRVTKTTDVLGNELINSFDANGQLWQVTHRYKKTDGTFETRNIVTRTFDASDRVLTEADHRNNVTSYTYDEVGNRIAVKDAEGHVSRIEYDAMNRQSAVVDATGYRTTMSYNQRGDLISVTNAKGETVKYEYDALGRKKATIDAKGYRTEYQYDANGNQTCFIDANAQAGSQPKNTSGCTRSDSYDELGRLVKSTDAYNKETSYTYDLLGNRLTVKDAKAKTWSFAYNELGYLSSQIDHRSKTTSYLTDQTGLVYQTTNRLNQNTLTTYDNAGRVKQVDYHDGTWQKHGYDVAGNLNSLSNGSGSTTALSYAFIYDNLNRLERKDDSRGRSLSFTFDKVGNILTKTTYQGSTTHYTYNAANRLVELRNPDYVQATYQYDGAGRLTSRVMSSGVTTHYSYDANGWQDTVQYLDSQGTIASAADMTRDRIGNILTVSRPRELDPSHMGQTTYVYDALYRLKSKDAPGTVSDEQFTYDDVGNRLTWTVNGGVRVYAYDAGTNRLTSVRQGSAAGPVESCYEHDDEGRRTKELPGNGTSCGTTAWQSYVWDAKGRLKSITMNGQTETYSYDPTDMRIARRVGSNGVDYFLEGEHLESVYATNGSLRAKYLRGVETDELLASWNVVGESNGLTAIAPMMYQQDELNSVRLVTMPNGSLIEYVPSYTAYGYVIDHVDPYGANPLGYTGREDDGTGFYYYRARYYDPFVGRFISEDPMGFEAGDINFYAYVGNNPINYNDPSGNCPMCIGAATSVILGGAIRYATGGDVFDAKAIAIDAALGAGGAGLVSKATQLYQARHIAAPLSVKLAARSGTAAQAEITSGIYFFEKAGQSYVGQGNIGARLTAHVANPAKPITSIDDAVRASVTGGRTSREVAEQYTLNNMGGVGAPGVLNLRNPIGAARQGLMGAPGMGVVESIATPAQSTFSHIGSGAAASSIRFPSNSNNGSMSRVYGKR